MKITVNSLKPGESGLVKNIESKGSVRQRLIDMGITPGAILVMRKSAPFGDPIQISIRGFELSLRRSEAEKIILES